MKALTFIKLASLVAVGAGGITSAVVFSNINTVVTPYMKVMTKNHYLSLMKQQNNDPNLYVDYLSLPTSNVSAIDLLEQNNMNDINGFIFTVGSQAYMQTNAMLRGVEKSYTDSNPYEVNASALMLKLYDLFYNDKSDNHVAIKDFNINFYSFLDIVHTKEVAQASDLLQNRRTQLGEKPPGNGTDIGAPAGASNVWKVKDPDTNITEDRPVVKLSSGSSDNIYFNYEPGTDYYEFLPDDGFETKYEKVYFRNQTDVALYNKTIDWMNNYASTYLSNISFSKEGSIVAAKKVDGVWTLSNFNYNSTLEDFIKFYNPEYDDSKQEGENGSTT